MNILVGMFILGICFRLGEEMGKTILGILHNAIKSHKLSRKQKEQ